MPAWTNDTWAERYAQDVGQLLMKGAEMKLDGKFHGVIVKNKDGSIVPQDQWMCFLAKDNAVPAMLDFYLKECERQGAAQEQLDAVEAMIERVRAWRISNPSLCKTPNVQPGELK